MIKVLVIITTSFVPYGGLTSVMMNLYRQIDKEKIHMDFASTNEELDQDLAEELKNYGSKYFSLGNRKKNLLRYRRNLLNVMKNGGYDVVHVNSNSSTAVLELSLAKKLGIKKRIVHNHTSKCNHRILNKLCSSFFYRSYSDAIACSRKAGEWIFGRHDFKILNNGIETSRYQFSYDNRMMIRNDLGIADTTIVLGHVGKIYKPKNHQFLIDIFYDYHKKNSDSVLILVGDGDLRNEIESKVAKLNLANYVYFVGMQMHPELYLSAMDYFVFPSIWEGMPLSVIEAQASGLKCLISDTIDNDVCITDSVHTMSITSGTQNWIDAITTYSKDSRKDISVNNIQTIKNAGYDAKYNSSVLEKIYLT
jgi:glycosyltransferase involved in cell wall biosynthesis